MKSMPKLSINNTYFKESCITHAIFQGIHHNVGGISKHLFILLVIMSRNYHIHLVVREHGQQDPYLFNIGIGARGASESE